MPAFDINRRTVLQAASGLACCSLGTHWAAYAEKGAASSVRWDATLADIHHRTFKFFWDTTPAQTGLTPDRWPTTSFCSIAAVGFALTAYCIGVKSGYVGRRNAAERVAATLRTFWHGPQGDGKTGVIGYKGFFYHFLNFSDATRYARCELSNVDTTMFLLGALTAAAYFDGAAPVEAEIRRLAQALFERVDWTFFERENGLLNMGWTPESGYNQTDWTGYDEGMMIYLLALASPTHPLQPKSWTAWCATYDQTWGPNFGKPHLGFGPLFGHQYPQVWYDLRGIADAYMRSRHSDYFTNSRLATIAQRNYAIRNPRHFADYGANIWGLTACDGPADVKLKLKGRELRFHTYVARGPSQSDPDMIDDGTIAPTAAISSIVFAPGICMAAAKAMLARYGADIYGRHGFFDSFNPTFRAGYPSKSGHQTKRAGWVSNDYIGIDQGPILAMLENYRSEFVWKLLRQDSYAGAVVKRGLLQAGFEPVARQGDWLKQGHDDP
ncbi:MAG: Tat pathway signal protein [Alphaproteobacteria bacterium]|nr:Tat pathway signal protein [Alphaproteobacteria bacterium]MDE2112115.1 Tat pathway signal protein [Alphaproteobacteria bacterium]MDE2493913.1 Tat pathway signal protein [Alphaproteobacteria bacterium]